MKALVGFIGLLVLLTGCAFGNRSVNLIYPPGIPPGGSPSRPSSTAAPDPTENRKVVLVALLDQRPSKLSVGAVHNGYGMHTADAVASNSVPGWVMKAIKTELTQQSFEVVELPEIPQTLDLPIISGDILTVMCQAYTRYESTVEFSVIASSAGRSFSRRATRAYGPSRANAE